MYIQGVRFDLPHHGHINLLKWCGKLAGENGKVIVALNTDEFIEEFKGKKPILNFKERKAIIESFPFIDKVVPNIGGQDSKKTINKLKIRIDCVVIGSDWHEKDYLKQMGFIWEWLEKNKIGICYVPYTSGISTTEIKRRLCER